MRSDRHGSPEPFDVRRTPLLSEPRVEDGIADGIPRRDIREIRGREANGPNEIEDALSFERPDDVPRCGGKDRLGMCRRQFGAAHHLERTVRQRRQPARDELTLHDRARVRAATNFSGETGGTLLLTHSTTVIRSSSRLGT